MTSHLLCRGIVVVLAAHARAALVVTRALSRMGGREQQKKNPYFFDFDGSDSIIYLFCLFVRFGKQLWSKYLLH